ncbi:hypothetical protein G7067_06910 [Leucobacter insecticola]|uniref:Uncharacterized protein n=1 Tax=Leucobacter insecticola TaxID=2714934 RepID=A0A6G8FIT5_9MICO|nr:hypothetical protein [Leucobacter insecticola]QIM16213.1 hypothetical protein G7067_06910 [Leucobacter insecticola]
MSDFKIEFEVEHPSEPPVIDVHYEWQCDALWMSGKYGLANLDGHEIGLSAELVQDLLAWVNSADAIFPADDPASYELPDNFLEDGYELARRVRAELPPEWVVTTWHPVQGFGVEVPLED